MPVATIPIIAMSAVSGLSVLFLFCKRKADGKKGYVDVNDKPTKSSSSSVHRSEGESQLTGIGRTQNCTSESRSTIALINVDCCTGGSLSFYFLAFSSEEFATGSVTALRRLNRPQMLKTLESGFIRMSLDDPDL
ncbi:hypothetical protein EVAR_21911_1 [Eumeta japonica]|uniref:Uncharacterized protein n=1 Tax=Eumeta variegata TaxID=151549 RepID=A0A4C1XJQ2_EUMVA|nr:hypothetical protein EVAR_21911_1 [Eumeta japonica]